MNASEDRLRNFFDKVVQFRWAVILTGLLLLLVAASQLGQLKKDTSAGAFIDPENPALQYRDSVREAFGLSDPIVVALINEQSHGVFNPQSLQLIVWLNERIAALDNVDPDRMLSLASESNVRGTVDGMEIDAFLDPTPLDQASADAVRDQIADFPLYLGSLVARDYQATLLVAELIDDKQAKQTYEAILALLADAPVGEHDILMVAGEGAVAGYLSSYIDQDARKLNPVAGLVITLVLFIAFRTLRATLLPNLIILVTVVITLGLMAATATPFYVISNGLIVCMIGIAVADSIHVFSQYYTEYSRTPNATQRQLVVRAMHVMVRPITVTTLTTAAGFLALVPVSSMPPVQAFGLFGAVGVLVAWLYTLTVLPAVLSLLKPQASRHFSHNAEVTGTGKALSGLGRSLLAHPGIVLLSGLLVVITGSAGLMQVMVEDQRIENFKSSEPLYQADKHINQRMDGTYHLDIVIDTNKQDGLHTPAYLHKIEKLQSFLQSLPHVNGTTSIADYIKQMHRAVNENRLSEYRIPDDEQLISQLFLLYSVSGDPTDLEEEIDSDHQSAVVRAYLDTDTFTNNRQLIPKVEAYVQDNFNEAGLSATVTGRVNVDYHWINGLAESHVGSVLTSVTAVLIMAALLFRSLIAGLLATVPVVVSILLIYAVMGFTGIWLGIGTSMFAAIAIGLGVDYAIHTLDRLRVLGHRQTDQSLPAALLTLYPTTGRVLLINLLAVALGFAVLFLSDVPPLIRFGTLVAVSVSAAFAASLLLLPALVLLFKPQSIVMANKSQRSPPSTAVSALVVVLLLIHIPLNNSARADALPTGLEVMQQVDAREEGEMVSRQMRMELTDRKGKTRVQEVKAFRRNFGEERRTVLFYTAPANVRDTAFLTYDYPAIKGEDDQWLYLPALRKVRRIPASSRGDYFLGTDFSYEEIKSENKVNLQDYTFITVGQDQIDGVDCLVVEGTPSSPAIAAELGYSKAVWHVDPSIGISRKSEYWDQGGNPLKTIEVRSIEKVDMIWTVLQISASNHKTGHSTVLTSENVDYEADIPKSIFDQRTLVRGL